MPADYASLAAWCPEFLPAWRAHAWLAYLEFALVPPVMAWGLGRARSRIG